MAPQNFSEAHQGAASGQMAVVIVDGLETVHIEQNDAEGALRAAGTIQLCFQDAEQAAIVGESGQRIADGHGAHLLEKACLVQERAGEHDDVADGFAYFREEKGTVEKLARESGSEVANNVQGG